MRTDRDTPNTELETMPNHVHPHVPVDPQTNSYFVATVGDTPEAVKRYVENQRNV